MAIQGLWAALPWLLTRILPLARLPLAVALDNGLALTPPMGLKPDFEAGADGLNRVADFLVTSRLADAG